MGPDLREVLGLSTMNDKTYNSLRLKVTSVKIGDAYSSVTVVPYGRSPECHAEQSQIFVDCALPWEWSCTKCEKDCLIRQCYTENTVLCNACKRSQDQQMNVDKLVKDEEDD